MVYVGGGFFRYVYDLVVGFGELVWRGCYMFCDLCFDDFFFFGLRYRDDVFVCFGMCI